MAAHHVNAWWTTHVAPDLQCTACRAAEALLSSRFHFQMPFPDADKNKWASEDDCSSGDRQRFIQGTSWESDGVVCCRFQSPHLSGSTWQHFWAIQLGERYAGVLFFLPTNRCIKLSRARQQTDGGVRCIKRKMFCSGPSCAFGRDVLSARRSNKVAVLHFFVLAKQPVHFVSPSQQSYVTWSFWGHSGKTFRFMEFLVRELIFTFCP